MKLSLILLFLVLPQLAMAACPSGQWQADYFNNMTLTGTAVLSRCETAINNDWGTNSPGGAVALDKFSARWTGQFSFTASSVTFTAITDDGMRVWLDTSLIIDSWKDQGPNTYTATRTVTAGTHDVKVEYYENGGGAVAKLSWVSSTVSTWQPRLTWTDNSTTETEFRIERCTGNACTSFAQIATVGANVATFVDSITGAVGTWYCWRVDAANATAVSGYSNTVCAAAPSVSNPPDGAPANVTVQVTVPPL